MFYRLLAWVHRHPIYTSVLSWPAVTYFVKQLGLDLVLGSLSDWIKARIAEYVSAEYLSMVTWLIGYVPAALIALLIIAVIFQAGKAAGEPKSRVLVSGAKQTGLVLTGIERSVIHVTSMDLTLIEAILLEGQNFGESKIIKNAEVRSLVTGAKITATLNGHKPLGATIVKDAPFTLRAALPNTGGGVTGNSIQGMPLDDFAKNFGSFQAKIELDDGTTLSETGSSAQVNAQIAAIRAMYQIRAAEPSEVLPASNQGEDEFWVTLGGLYKILDAHFDHPHFIRPLMALLSEGRITVFGKPMLGSWEHSPNHGLGPEQQIDPSYWQNADIQWTSINWSDRTLHLKGGLSYAKLRFARHELMEAFFGHEKNWK